MGDRWPSHSVWVLGLFQVAVLLTLVGAILSEERFLERKFGPEHLAYKARVRRWV